MELCTVTVHCSTCCTFHAAEETKDFVYTNNCLCTIVMNGLYTNFYLIMNYSIIFMS